MRTLRGFPAVALLPCLKLLTAEAGEFLVRETPDRLVITRQAQPVAEFVFKDDRILRPYFANIHAPDGYKITRNHPPVPGQDATDHETMHPGLWLAFGDLNGQDFWRNKARMEHVRFSENPKTASGQLTFATECQLLTANRAPLCMLRNRFTLVDLTNAWMLIWHATIQADSADITFGDQEEMGFGTRVATAITEQNGGIITSSSGLKTAKRTWGQPAEWCDYSKAVESQHVGLTLMAHPSNFRQSWWHNRDYGLLVANPFGREALNQGAKSAVLVKRDEEFHLRFGAAVYSSTPAPNQSVFFKEFLARVTDRTQ